MARGLVGLAMTDSGLLAAEVEGGNGSRPTLRRVGELDLPRGVLSGSEVNDSAALTQAITELWERTGFRSKRVVLGIGNQRVLVRNHTVPQVSAAHLGKALRYQVRDFLPVPVTETILDFYPIAPVPESKPPQMEGLLVAALKDKVELKVDAIANARLKVVGVDLSPFAMLRALRRGDALAGKKAVISIGDRVTNIVVAQDGVPQFVRIIPLGNSHVTDALMSGTKTSRDNVKELKQQIGLLGGANQKYQLVASMIRDAADPIFDQIRSTQAYYQNNFTGGEIESVIVLGSESRIPGFLEEIGNCCGLTAEFGRPLESVNTAKAEPQQILASREPDLAVPIGLALGWR